MYRLCRKAALVAVMGAALAAGGARLAVLSDVHVVPGNANESRLREAVDEINALGGIDFVVMNGDLTNEGTDEQLLNVKGILDGLRPPLLVLPGNHENNWSQSAGQTFVRLWGDDRFVAATDSLVLVGVNCGPYMKMGDGHVKQEDLHWLRSTLAVHAGRRVVSFCHYPLTDDLDNYMDYASILAEWPTQIHVNGHYHVNKPYECGGIPCMMVRSLDRKNGDYGYTLMDVTPDSVIISEKRLGEAPRRLTAFGARDSAYGGFSLSRPSAEVVHAVKLHADSASIFTRLAFDCKNVYFGNSLGQVKALDKLTGEVATLAETRAPIFGRALAVKPGVIYVPTTSGELLRIDSRRGDMRPSAGKGPYVADGLVDGERMYQGGFKSMECRGADDGRLLWRYDSIGNYCQAAPVADGGDLVFGAWDSYLYCLDAATGELRWRWNNGKTANMLGPGNVVPVVTPDKVVIVAPDRFMTAIDRKSGETLWRDNSHKYRESLGRSADGTRAYAKTMDGELVAVDLTSPNFKELWTLDMGMGYEHAPCIVAECNGVVYAGSRRGVIAAVDGSGRMLWTEKIGSSEVNGIDVDPADGAVYVSLVEGTIFRLK